MRTLKLKLEYDGTNYVGWQRQAEGVSIQGLLEDAFSPLEGAPITVHGAGRTDAGVHALGQIASLVTTVTHDPRTLQRALNAGLPVDVRIIDVEEALPGFHARFDAVSKIYEYRIVNAPFVSAFDHRYVWHVPGALDVDAMRDGVQAILGTHDFSAFQASGGDASHPERTIISAGITGCPRGEIAIRVEGNGFLRHMVRTVAGTLVDVGLGRWPASHVAEIIRGRDRRAAGRAAPPSGLFLIAVRY